MGDVRHGLGQLRFFLLELGGLLVQADDQLLQLAAQQAHLALGVLREGHARPAVQDGIQIVCQARYATVAAVRIQKKNQQKYKTQRTCDDTRTPVEEKRRRRPRRAQRHTQKKRPAQLRIFQHGGSSRR